VLQQEVQETQAAADKAGREARRVAQLAPWERQIYDDERIMAEMQGKLPPGAVLSLMDLPADVRARALGAPSFRPSSVSALAHLRLCLHCFAF